VSRWFGGNGPARRYAPGVGRSEQPPGRHRQGAQPVLQRLVPNQPHADGLYPVGQPFRVSHDRDTLEALDSLDNNPNDRTNNRRGTK
jgi:hypothetical protein